MGFLAALVLAWHHVGRGEQRVTGMEIAMLAALLAVAPMGKGDRAEAAPRGGDSPSGAAPAMEERSIAVPPFVNTSPEKGQER